VVDRVNAVPCDGCRACCQGPDRALLLDPERDDPARYAHVRDDAGNLWLAQDEHDTCVYLGESGCTIYDERPFHCRVFDCRALIAHPRFGELPEHQRRAAHACMARTPPNVRIPVLVHREEG